MWASTRGHLDVARLLVGSGADVNDVHQCLFMNKK
jgi:ankyrin repeat protein